MRYPNLLASFTGLIGESITKADLLPSPTMPILKAVSLVELIVLSFIAEEFIPVLIKEVLFREILLRMILFTLVLFIVTLSYPREVITTKDTAVMMVSSFMKYIHELVIFRPPTRTHRRI